jgi:hypothetical protein
MAAEKYIAQPIPSQSYLSHFMKPKNQMDNLDTQSNNTDVFQKTGKDMIKEAKENCKHSSI